MEEHPQQEERSPIARRSDPSQSSYLIRIPVSSPLHSGYFPIFCGPWCQPLRLPKRGLPVQLSLIARDELSDGPSPVVAVLRRASRWRPTGGGSMRRQSTWVGRRLLGASTVPVNLARVRVRRDAARLPLPTGYLSINVPRHITRVYELRALPPCAKHRSRDC